jgi:hypothetical protein
MIQPSDPRAPVYKSGKERIYTRAQLELAYEDLRFRLMLASMHPSKQNRKAATLSVIARDHEIDRASLYLFVTWKTEHE